MAYLNLLLTRAEGKTIPAFIEVVDLEVVILALPYFPPLLTLLFTVLTFEAAGFEDSLEAVRDLVLAGGAITTGGNGGGTKDATGADGPFSNKASGTLETDCTMDGFV